jgi:1-acyl-sn-glycerol-3-phosphate acyltransferase
MYLTIFGTPITKQLLSLFSRVMLKLLGWKIIGDGLSEKKYIMLAGPHTSNWDFPLMLMYASVLGLKPYWMGKKAIFVFGLGWFFKWLGGISIDRSKNNSLVSQMVEIFGDADELLVLIPPEGTRKRREKWKTGFYHIAEQGDIPLILGFLDYDKKEGGYTEVYRLTGDFETEMRRIQNFYASKGACYPEEFAGEFIDENPGSQ